MPQAHHSRAHLQLLIRGQLSPIWHLAFENFEVAPEGANTSVSSDLVDQPTLLGVLTTVRDLGLQIESLAYRRGEA